MTKQKQNRCMSLFLSGIDSSATKKAYLYHLEKFLEWNNLTEYDDLLKADSKAIQRNLEDYLMYLKNSGKSANCIPNIILPVELFYVMNDVTLNTRKLRKMFPAKTKAGGYGAYT